MTGIVTERDERILRWMVQWKGVTAQQVAAALITDEGWAQRKVEGRFRLMRDLGLVQGRQLVAGMRSVHWVTRDGLRFLGLGGSVQEPSLAQLHHDLAVVDCATWVQQVSGHQIVSERQIRSRDRVQDETEHWQYAVQPTPIRATAAIAEKRMVIPDFVSVNDDGLVFAHEVERTGKHSARIADLMWSYVNAEHIHRVRYYARADIRTRFERTAKDINGRAHLNNKPRKVFVTGWDWEDE